MGRLQNLGLKTNYFKFNFSHQTANQIILLPLGSGCFTWWLNHGHSLHFFFSSIFPLFLLFSTPFLKSEALQEVEFACESVPDPNILSETTQLNLHETLNLAHETWNLAHETWKVQSTNFWLFTLQTVQELHADLQHCTTDWNFQTNETWTHGMTLFSHTETSRQLCRKLRKCS